MGGVVRKALETPNILILFDKILDMMVLQERIELSTSPLPRVCSTTELLQRRVHAEPSGTAGVAAE